MRADLEAYIWRRVGEPFAWGVCDCVMFATGALAACGAPDPFADLRGRYSTAAEAARLASREGGLLPMMMGRLGPATSAGPAPAVALGCIEGRLTAGIWTGSRLLVKTAAGITLGPRPLFVWPIEDRAPCPR